MSSRTISPPKARVLSVGTSSGESKLAIEGVRKVQLTLRRFRAPAGSLILSCSEGIHTQPPETRVVKISELLVSNVYAANWKTREAFVMHISLLFATMEQKPSCFRMIPLGFPVLPEVKQTNAALLGEALARGFGEAFDSVFKSEGSTTTTRFTTPSSL